MTVIRCPKCGKQGSLHLTNVGKYQYYRIAHYAGLEGTTRKVKWCYLNKKLLESLKKQHPELFTQNTTLITRNDYSNQNPQTTLKSQKEPLFQTLKKRAGSSVV